MPVQKFRSIALTPSVEWRRAGDSELYRALSRLWRTSRQLHPRRFPAGVYKHRAMDSMDRQRDAWLTAHVRALRSAASENRSDPDSGRSDRRE